MFKIFLVPLAPKIQHQVVTNWNQVAPEDQPLAQTIHILETFGKTLARATLIWCHFTPLGAKLHTLCTTLFQMISKEMTSPCQKMPSWHWCEPIDTHMVTVSHQSPPCLPTYGDCSHQSPPCLPISGTGCCLYKNS